MSNLPNDEVEVDLPEYDGEVVERIDKSTLKPMYDTDHEHNYQPDPDDETEDYQAYMCTVEGCNLGFLSAKY